MSVPVCSKCKVPIPSEAAFCPGCGQKLAKPAKASRRGAVGLLLLLVFVVAIVWIISSAPSTQPVSSSAASASVPQPKPHDLALQATEISKFSWYKDGFGSIMMANFTIKNNGDLPVKDIEIKCIHSAPSGTVIDSNDRTIYEIVPAHKSRAFRNFNMGFIESQASQSSCRIEDLAISQ